MTIWPVPVREALPRSRAAPRARCAKPRADAGFALVEVLVSALVATLVAGAVLSLLGATAKTAADQRTRSAAYAVAQEDQARLRSLRVPVLNKLSQTRTVTLNGRSFTVNSTGQFINDATGTASCGQGTSSADYIKVTSSVTWANIGGRPPVVIQSIIAPPTGSLDSTHGTLTISAINAQGAPLSGIGVSGSGAGSFSGSTDSTGCAVFPDQAAGNYTLTPSGGAPGTVDKDGNPPTPSTISVIAGTTNTVALQYDSGGSIPVTFRTRIGSAPTLTPSSADSVVVFNTGMTTARTYGTPGGTRLSTVTATPVFPFTSPDTVYAGACTGNNPNPTAIANPPGAAAIASVTVPSGGSAPASVQLPALNLTVFSGTSTVPGSAVSNAHVIVSDSNCSVSGNPVKRVYATNTSGKLTDPGLPWSTYSVCVDNGTRRKTTSGVSVQDLLNGTTLNVFMGSGTTSGVCT